MDPVEIILGLAERYERDPDSILTMSASEVIAVALITENLDLLPPTYKGLMEALDRLGPRWREGLVDAWRIKRGL
jgi:hypothetical protein